jgi:hypothetical protein
VLLEDIAPLVFVQVHRYLIISLNGSSGAA